MEKRPIDEKTIILFKETTEKTNVIDDERFKAFENPENKERKPIRKRVVKKTFWQKYAAILVLCAFVLVVSSVITLVIELFKQQPVIVTETEELIAANGPEQQTDDFVFNKPSALLPKNGIVPLTYFDDALFIGDSITVGMLEYNSGIKNGYHAAYLGALPKEITNGTLFKDKDGNTIEILQYIKNAPVNKIYIMLGTNALPTLTDEAFIKYYEDMLDTLVVEKPDCTFYIQSILPVDEETATNEDFAIDRIQGLNEQLEQIAWARGMYYLDIYSVMANDNNYLSSEIASGGYHINNKGYTVWREYLMTHTVYSTQNNYLSGSPAYIKR